MLLMVIKEVRSVGRPHERTRTRLQDEELCFRPLRCSTSVSYFQVSTPSTTRTAGGLLSTRVSMG